MSEKVKVGKYVLENLTTGMYEDSKIIFREYVQNSADQIDKAKRDHLFVGEPLYIDIKIDPIEKFISIKDNATGIASAEVKNKLADIADSDKVKGQDKGFRGIGRLGGLAYCETLNFITTFEGEKTKTVMSWNSKLMREYINDQDNNMSLEEILEKVIKYESFFEEKSEHYFVVEMVNVLDQNKNLLNEERVEDYIAWNCPVPIRSEFMFRSKIRDYAEKLDYPIDEYKIYLNNNDVLRPYAHRLYNTSGIKYDEIFDLDFHKIRNSKGILLAWAWVGMSGFVNQIPEKNNRCRSIRLRKENIQIGNEDTLNSFFKESRGNGYFIGEIHVVHPDLIPNARRDYFNQNETSAEFESAIRDYFKKLHSMYYDANKYKIYVRDIKRLQELKNIQGEKKFVSKKDKEEFERTLESALKKDEEAKQKLDKLKDKLSDNSRFTSAMKNAYDKSLHENDGQQNDLTNDQKITAKKETNFIVDELSSLRKSERRIVAKIYEILRENLAPDICSELIKKIQDEIK